MPGLIILRLYPVEPVDGDTFRKYLTDLTIKAFDLTVGDSVSGAPLGTASGLADPHLNAKKDTVDLTKVQILQHYLDIPVPLTVMRVLEAAATAVIVANPPPDHPEYPSTDSFDIRLE